MRVFRQTIVLILIFGILIALYFLYIKPKEEAKKTQEKAQKKLIDIAQEKVEEIWITYYEKGEKIGFRKSGKSKWDIISPIFADADRFSVNPIVSRFSSIDIERIIDENADTLSPFGLDPPRYEVQLKLSNSSDQVTIFIGNKSQVGYNVYATRADTPKKVFLVSAALESVIAKSLDDFREKRPMDFITADVDEFSIRSQDKTFLFKRNIEGDWEILFPDIPTFVKADDSKVRELLYSTSSLKVKDFVSDTSPPVNLYGLENPDRSIWVKTKDGDTFALFVKFADGTIYGKKPEKPNIFTLEADENLKKIMKKDLVASDYRNRKVLDFYVWRVKELSVERVDRAKILRRDKVDTEKWYIVVDGENKLADSAKVKDMLKEVSDIQVLKFVKDNTDISQFIPNPIIRLKIEIEGKADPYYVILGEKKTIEGVTGIIGAVGGQNSVYLFPVNITKIISKIESLEPVEEKK